MKRIARKPISRRRRFEVFERDDFTCQYCGARPGETQLELDHVKPVRGGGDSSIRNLITACFDCNRGKGKHALAWGLPPGLHGALEWWDSWNNALDGSELPRTQPRRMAPIDQSIPVASYLPIPLDRVLQMAECFQ